jgi:hypothetical protein
MAVFELLQDSKDLADLTFASCGQKCSVFQGDPIDGRSGGDSKSVG